VQLIRGDILLDEGVGNRLSFLLHMMRERNQFRTVDGACVAAMRRSCVAAALAAQYPTSLTSLGAGLPREHKNSVADFAGKVIHTLWIGVRYETDTPSERGFYK